MCTVSYVVANGKTIITSNRDEKVFRPSAIEPKNYSINNKNIFFPKDPKAGGTWYALREDGTIIVLLNGAAEKHQVKQSYKISRGLIVLDIISSDSILNRWNTIDLMNVEPFTLIYFQNKELYQLRWNEIEKETIKLNITKNYIWSSATLYPKEISQQRTNWFYDFLDTKPEVSPQEMLNFHRYTQNDDPQNGLIINRNDEMKTLSITQTVIEKNKVVLSHIDLQKQKEFTNSFINI